MILSAIRRSSSSRSTFPARWCILLFAILSAAAPIFAQPTEIDWRSTLVLHFDPATYATKAERGGTYLAQIAEGLESGWVAESGAGVVSVGPLFARTQGSTVDHGTIDPTLGTSEDWMRLMSASEQTDIAVAVRLNLRSSTEDYSRLAAWTSDAGVRHFVLEGAAISDAAALRVALHAASPDTIWIAALSDVSMQSAATRRGAAAVTSEVNRFAETSDVDPVAPQSTSDDAVADRIDATLFDAFIESLPAGELDDDSSLGLLYSTVSQRRALSNRPLIAAVQGGTDLLLARALMLPGALQITVPAVPTGSSDLWQLVAAFRARHPAVTRGEHEPLINNTFTFARISSDVRIDDRVIVVLGASGQTTINVSRVYPDNALLQDALTGRTAFVSFGMATFEAGPSGVLLIEEAR